MSILAEQLHSMFRCPHKSEKDEQSGPDQQTQQPANLQWTPPSCRRGKKRNAAFYVALFVVFHINDHNTGGVNWLLHPQLLRCSWRGTFFSTWYYWIWNACVVPKISLQIEHTLSDQLQHHWATAGQFYMAFCGYVIKWDRYWHILQFPHFTDDWNEIDRMEESLDRLWKIQKLLEILYSIFSKVYSNSKDQAAESLFFFSKERQFSNNVLLRNTNV